MNEKWGLTVRGLCEWEDRILLLRLRPDSPHDAGKWEIPGGKVKECEFFDDALRREYLEETGLEITVEEFSNVYRKDYIAYKSGEVIKSIHIIMRVGIKTDEVKISDEHDMYGWFTLEEIMTMLENNQLTDPTEGTFLR